jgi:hypothetical protein
MDEPLNQGEPSAESTAAPESTGGDSVRSAIEAAIASFPDADAAAPSDPVSSAQADAAPTDSTGAPVRDEKGRFAPKAGDAPAAPAQTDAAAQPQHIGPPLSWRAEAKIKFAELPPEIKDEISRRDREIMADYTRKTQSIAQTHAKYRELDEAIAPHVDQFALMGVSPGQAVKQLIAAQNYLDRDAVGGIQFLMRSYGVTPEQVFNHEQAQPQQQSAPNAELSAVQRELAELKNLMTQHQQTAKQSTMQSVMGEISSFAAELDAQGKPLRPYINEVVEDMAPIVSRLRRTNPQAPMRAILEDAYSRAVRANPQTYEHVAAADAAKRLEDAKAKAQAAKNAGVSINGAPGVGTGTAPDLKSARSTLEWVIAQNS